jgi:SPP1 family predicted phage head-tail adaptor
MTETRTTFSGGAYTTSWTTASTEWANVQTENAYEDYGQDKKQQYTKYIVKIRAGVTATNSNRIAYDSKILVIETMRDPTYRKRMKILECREEVGS